MNEYIYLVIASSFLFLILRWFIILKRKRFIKNYLFPSSVIKKTKEKYPHLNDVEIDMISKALKDYFYITHVVGKLYISMPSKIVSDFWHEFSFSNENYEKFCKKAFGKEIQWIEAEGIEGKGIQRIWENVCVLENIDPLIPEKVPRLFRLDRLLKVKNGFWYTHDCRKLNKEKNEYCVTKIMNSKKYENAHGVLAIGYQI